MSAASEYWSDVEIERFEVAVAGYGPAAPAELTDAERRLTWHKATRKIRQSLLGALPRERVSANTLRHIEEEQRALANMTLEARVSMPRVIGAMMSADEIARASDDDVLNAFTTVPDATEWSHPRRFMTGGEIFSSHESSRASPRNPHPAASRMDAQVGSKPHGIGAPQTTGRLAGLPDTPTLGIPHRLPTLAALAPTSSPLLQQRFME